MSTTPPPAGREKRRYPSGSLKKTNDWQMAIGRPDRDLPDWQMADGRPDRDLPDWQMTDGRPAREITDTPLVPEGTVADKTAPPNPTYPPWSS